MKNVWSQHAIGIMFPIFVAFLLQQSMAFCSSFGYRYYSTRCWLVRHQMLTTNRWNKILRIHSGYDLSSGAVCRFYDSFLDSGHKKNPCFASSLCDGVISHIRVSAAGTSKWAVFLYYPRYRGLSSSIFLKISRKKGLAKAFQPCSNEYGMVWVKHF